MIRLKPTLDEGGWADNSITSLLCPLCGGNNLHHGAVTVFSRSEDDDNVRRTIVDRNSVTVRDMPNNVSGNPSSRRNGLRIGFECENCDTAELSLDIWQHKGTTYVVWKQP